LNDPCGKPCEGSQPSQGLSAVTTDLVAQVVRERGHITLTLQGRSMTPTLPPGARITVERCDPAALRPGQVVALARDGHIVAHRVMRVQSSPAGLTLVTKGDRGYAADDAVIPAERIIGLVTEALDPASGARLPLNPGFWVRWGRVQMALGRRKGWVPRRIYPLCRRLFDFVHSSIRRFVDS